MEGKLGHRTKKFALDVIELIESLPINKSNDVIGRQLIRSATSVGANYRAVSRAKSGKDFINKLKICEEEADESIYWLELLESRLKNDRSIPILKKEADEITAMLVSSIKTMRNKV